MDIIGIRVLKTPMQIFFLLSQTISTSPFLGACTNEFATFDFLLILGVEYLGFSNSSATRTTKTTMGIRSPCISQTSISLKLESSGSFSWILLYRVNMTRFDVSETIIMASKCDLSRKRVTSAASIKQMDGMKSDIQNGELSLSKLTSSKIALFPLTSIEQFFTSNLLWELL